MAKIYEEISKSIANSSGKPDSNLANDSNNLGGIPAEDYATKKYVQDYHNTKEASQKEYIDQRDRFVLQEAKEYTNSQVRNQDFSDFAKVTDVQALDDKLSEEFSEELSTGLTAQKNYTDSKVQAVVNDINANFTDVNNAISTLNSNQNNLFQSVSSGKSKIAGAITDKGVATSADDSFATMANNIRAIPTSSGGGGGGETDPNYVNTSDANATANDILLGKTAYVKGQKVYGTLIQEAEPGMPTYGTDTSGATATESDIAYGKTAYARGQLLVGTMQNADVEEICGLSDEYEFTTQNPMNNIDPVTNETIYSRTLMAFSKNLDYCVSLAIITNSDGTTSSYIESHAVNNNGLYVQGSTNVSGETTYKKYRYTLAELGLSNCGVLDIALGAPGLGGDSNKCLLIITTRKSEEIENSTNRLYKWEIHLYTYHLSENGVIGKMYDNEKGIIENLTDVYYSTGSSVTPITRMQKIVSFNSRYNEFYILSYISSTTKIYAYKLNINTDNNGGINYNVNKVEHSGLSEKVYEIITVSDDDKYIIATRRCYVDGTEIIINDTSLSQYVPETIFSISSTFGHSVVPINGLDKYLHIYNTTIYINSFSSAASQQQSIAHLTDTNTNSNSYGIVSCGAYLTADSKKLVVLTCDRLISPSDNYDNFKVRIYNVENILANTSSEDITAETTYSLIADRISFTSPPPYTLCGNTSGSNILILRKFKDIWNV